MIQRELLNHTSSYILAQLVFLDNASSRVPHLVLAAILIIFCLLPFEVLCCRCALLDVC